MIKQTGFKNILFTGDPGCGKSTLLKNLIQKVPFKKGILTESIIENNQRIGFILKNELEMQFPFASLYNKSNILFNNKRFIHLEGLDQLIQYFNTSSDENTLLFLDEIAPMQLYHKGFQAFSLQLLNSKNPFLGVIKLFDGGNQFLQEVKQRRDTLIINLSQEQNLYNEQFYNLLIKKIIKSQQYYNQKEKFIKIDNNTWEFVSSSHRKRTLKQQDGFISCDCDCNNKYGICSHSLALQQI